MSVMAISFGGEFPESIADEPPIVGYLIVIERGSSGFGAYVPDLPGVVAAADTESEVRALIEEAIDFHLDGLREDGLEVPAPTSRAEVVRR